NRMRRASTASTRFVVRGTTTVDGWATCISAKYRQPASAVVKKLLPDPVGVVPEVGLEEAELLVDLELGDECVDLLVGQAGQHLDGFLVSDLDDVWRQLGDVRHDLHRALRLVVPDVDGVLLRVVEIAGDRRVLRQEVVVHEVADVNRKAARPPGGLAPEIDLLDQV